jgi:hypothetical protein
MQHVEDYGHELLAKVIEYTDVGLRLHLGLQAARVQ